MRKIIWIINQYASHLEARHLELAKVFSSKGYSVVVVTSSFHHGKQEYLFDEDIKVVERQNGLTYVYLHASPSYGTNGSKRVLNMLSFCRKCEHYKEQMTAIYGKPNFIIASSAPPFVWETGYKLSKRYKAKFIAEFRDIWPLSLVEVQEVSPSHPFVILLERIEKRAYLRADAIVSTMPHAWKHVLDVVGVKRERVHWMPNGINVAEAKADLHNDLCIPNDLDDYLDNHWCCVYIGSIVKSENVDFIIESFSKVDDTDVWMAIIGDGNEKERLIQRSKDLGIDRIKYFSSIDRHLIPKVLRKAKAAVGAGNNLPIYRFGVSVNKLNDYLLAGVPTIYFCTPDSVANEAGHFSFLPDNTEKMAETLSLIKKLSNEEIEKLKNNGRMIIEEQYDYQLIGENYIRMMESL